MGREESSEGAKEEISEEVREEISEEVREETSEEVIKVTRETKDLNREFNKDKVKTVMNKEMMKCSTKDFKEDNRDSQ